MVIIQFGEVRPLRIARFVVRLIVLGACFVTLARTAVADDASLLNNSDFGDTSLDPSQYSLVPGFQYQQSECSTNLEDSEGSPNHGPYGYSCRTTRLAHLPDGKIWKFMVLACRNGNLDRIAWFKSSAADQDMLFAMQLKAAKVLGQPGPVSAPTARSCVASP